MVTGNNRVAFMVLLHRARGVARSSRSRDSLNHVFTGYNPRHARSDAEHRDERRGRTSCTSEADDERCVRTSAQSARRFSSILQMRESSHERQRNDISRRRRRRRSMSLPRSRRAFMTPVNCPEDRVEPPSPIRSCESRTKMVRSGPSRPLAVGDLPRHPKGAKKNRHEGSPRVDLRCRDRSILLG